ncbi:hypothetical protein [Streptomyces chiangmaiensis]|uniref:Uncharacterized protein n=1 Tax=Streptomyces chiangmaiensis TaxID=766497 RepID=A0ABU7FM87_9ACTN|nr:hypothetical protein [Streptomyces chiangmaiensis]MED7824797.1 hypothetical protein [Streptomyces chiangmaiensis]
MAVDRRPVRYPMPAADPAAAAGALTAAGRTAAADPQGLVPLFVEAARGVPDARHRDLVHALRAAGFTT